MYKIAVTSLLVLCLFSCSDNENNNEPIIEKIAADIPEEDIFPYDSLAGMYIGDFAGSDIRLILNYVSSKNAIGYDIHKGLQRNIMGKVQRSGDSVTVTLNEPGDNQYDGTFTLHFIGYDDEVSGEWVSNSGKIRPVSFDLKKMRIRQPKDENDITLSNLSEHFGYLGDTLDGHYQFKNDGLCIYEYYPNQDNEDRIEQMITIHGSWSLDGKKVIVEWQPNSRFPERRSEFDIVKTEWEEITLSTEGQNLYNYYYGP